MNHPFRRSASLTSGALLALLVVMEPRSTVLAQMPMDHGGAAAVSGTRTFKRGDITVTSPWTRATPGGARIAGGYFSITNGGTASDRFTGARSDAADRVEVHEMSMSDGVMKMRPLP